MSAKASTLVLEPLEPETPSAVAPTRDHAQQHASEQQQQQQQHAGGAEEHAQHDTRTGLKGILPRLFPNHGLAFPGKFDNYNREAEHSIVNLDLFDGAMFNSTKAISEKFATVHSIRMGGTHVPPGYEFGAHYFTDRVQLVGRMTMQGTVHANYVHAITPNMTSKLTAALFPDDSQHQSQGAVELEYDGYDFASKLVLTSSMSANLSFMQALSHRASLGLQLVAQPRANQVGGVVVGRYNHPHFVATASLSSFGILSSSYVQKVSEKVSLATNIEYHIPSGKSEVLVGYDYNMRSARVQGRITSSGTVACCLEEKMAPGVSLLLNGQADYMHDKFSFGIGFTVQT